MLIYYKYLYKAADGNFYQESATSTKNIETFLKDWSHDSYKGNRKLLKCWEINFDKRKFIKIKFKENK